MTYKSLEEFFKDNKKVALAFSGGVDSAYLLYAGLRDGADIKAYYVRSAFQADFELEDAKRLVADLGADMEIIHLDVLVDPKIRANSPDRCYYCKERIFSTIIKKAKEDGYDILVDGTNGSDSYDDRPGMRALEELKVLSPLRLAGLTKDQIRALSKEAGLFTWDKDSYSCLATRVPTDEEISQDKLDKIEAGEDYLFSLGFKDFRLRYYQGAARLQLKEEDLAKVMENRQHIVDKLKEGFSAVLLDLEVR
ncbi:MAG: ATP-dependent sacrificial sulfur transferase LarE [Bacillota bacterium]|nr:ATP-dependent sacrificial sulfur transferase LarE [Bacillota bacterium]